MGTQFIESAFRSLAVGGAVVSDWVPPNLQEHTSTDGTGTGTDFASTGAAIIENVSAQAPMGQIWSFIGWSITLVPYITYDPTVTSGANVNENITQLGRIIAGLTFANATPTGQNAAAAPTGFGYDSLWAAYGTPLVPWALPMPNLPTNTFGMSVIWDGVTDTVPPNGGGELALPPVVPMPVQLQNWPGGAAGMKPLVTNYPLPMPVQIYPGQQMQFGLWITPSMATNIALGITQASYTIVVDDGQPQVTTWGRDQPTELAH